MRDRRIEMKKMFRASASTESSAGMRHGTTASSDISEDIDVVICKHAIYRAG
jgi:hypothetical protein